MMEEKTTISILETLRAVNIFPALSSTELTLVAPLFESLTLPEDSVIFEQKQTARKLFILTRGRVLILFKPYDGEALEVAEIEPGGVFGWSAALGRSRYTSSAKCTEEGEALSVGRNELRGFYREHPSIGVPILEGLAAVLAKRMHGTQEVLVDLLISGMN
ncbi:MAG: Crp/Fnr family transcriptional regulator [Anaerolineales bacterium]